MAYNIKIRGVIDSIDWDWGEEVFTPSMIESELERANGDDLLIDIDSVGGCVHSGINIYTKIRRYAQEHNAVVTTRTDGFVASIATIVFSAGDKRIVNEFMQPFVHEPWMMLWSVTATEVRKDLATLEATKHMLADFYSKHTTLSYTEAHELMENDTWMTAEYCKEIGFATEIETLSNSDMRLVASLRSNLTTTKNNTMTKKKTSTLSWMKRITNAMGPAPKAQLELADEAGKLVVFPELEVEDTPKLGDKVTYDGDAMYTGSLETEEYIIEVLDGVITEVIVIAEIDKDEIIDELVAKIETLNAEVVASKEENTRLNGVINSIKSDAKPDTTKTTAGNKGEEISAVDASIAKIRNRRKNAK